MMRYVKIYLISLKNNIAVQLTYRANLLFCILMTVAGELIMPMITILIYNNGVSFEGWSVNEVLLIQGIFIFSRGLANTFFFGLVTSTLGLVSEGTYDLLLIKPVSPLFLSTATYFDIDSVGSILSGAVIAGIALHRIGAVHNALLFLLLMLLSMTVLFAFALFMSGIVFKWVDNSRIYEIFEAAAQFGYYPTSIYSRSFRFIVSYILPVSLIGYFPAAALLGRPAPNILPLIAVAILILLFGAAFWRFMLSKYTSAGG